jgi:hypothetical protein
MPYPKHQRKAPSSLLTVYAKKPKQSLHKIAAHGSKAFIGNHFKDLWTSPEQHAFRNMIHDPQWESLHRDHDLIKTDKNMSTAVVAHSWSTIKSKAYLEDKTFYSHYKTFSSLQQQDATNSSYCTKISNRLGNIKPRLRLLAPDPDAYLPYFYVLSKVHKTPVGAHPITGAFKSSTSKISKAVSDILGQIFECLVSGRLQHCHQNILNGHWLFFGGTSRSTYAKQIPFQSRRVFVLRL